MLVEKRLDRTRMNKGRHHYYKLEDAEAEKCLIK